MNSERFVYAIYIASDPKTVWKALLDGEFTRKYWEHDNVSDWKPGSPWEHRPAGGGQAKLVGKVVEIVPPRRLVLTWAMPSDAASMAAPTRVTFELEPIEDMVRLTVTHDQIVPGSEMQRGIENGWPRVLSSLKSFLETGKPLPTWAQAGKPAQAAR